MPRSLLRGLFTCKPTTKIFPKYIAPTGLGIFIFGFYKDAAPDGAKNYCPRFIRVQSVFHLWLKISSPTSRPSRDQLFFQCVAQFLFVIAHRLAVTFAADFQRGRDDFRARINLAPVNQRPEAAAIVRHVMPLFLVKRRTK